MVPSFNRLTTLLEGEPTSLPKKTEIIPEPFERQIDSTQIEIE